MRFFQPPLSFLLACLASAGRVSTEMLWKLTPRLVLDVKFFANITRAESFPLGVPEALFGRGARVTGDAPVLAAMLARVVLRRVLGAIHLLAGLALAPHIGVGHVPASSEFLGLGRRAAGAARAAGLEVRVR